MQIYHFSLNFSASIHIIAASSTASDATSAGMFVAGVPVGMATDLSLVLYICKNPDETMDFDVVKEIVDETFLRYEGAYLNELVEFTDGASVEAIGDFLFEDLRDKLAPRGLTLVQLDVGDNPLSMYQIGCGV